ncbi:trp operon leader peptide [Citrobacter sp. RHB25-C09]|nr:trp operon leader peptide [Citrobacter sp. RHB25-C09]
MTVAFVLHGWWRTS